MSTEEKEPWHMELPRWRIDPTIPQPKFTFYQEVVVNENAKDKKNMGLVGTVLAIGEGEGDKGDEYGYDISFWCHGKGPMMGFMEYELNATGKFFKREDYYPSEDLVIHVSMDGEIIPD